MIHHGELQEHHKELIMSQFDTNVLENFRDMERPHKAIKVSGESTIYNFVEECHKFKAKNFELKGEDGLHERVDICNIVSVNARGNPVEPPPIEPQRGGKNKKRGGRQGQGRS